LFKKLLLTMLRIDEGKRLRGELFEQKHCVKTGQYTTWLQTQGICPRSAKEPKPHLK